MYKGDTLYSCSEERIKALFEVFSACPDRKAVTKAFSEKMKKLGAQIVTDDLGNIYASLKGSDTDGKKTVISCSDTGDVTSIASALETCEMLIKSEIPHKHTLTVLLWNDEPAVDAPELVPAIGVICKEYLPDEIRGDYKHIGVKKQTDGKKHRLNTSEYSLMFEVHESPAVKDFIGIADIVPAAKNPLKRGELRYNEKLIKLTGDAVIGCGMKSETLHFTPKRDTWIASNMLPTAVILAGEDDTRKCADAATVLLNAVLQADII